MTEASLLLYIIKLVLGGIVAFLAILLWSKTRDAAWMSLVSGAVIQYAGIVYSMLIDFGVVFTTDLHLAGIPVTTLLFTIVPQLLFILAFALMIKRNS
ncbi:MAG TPA: hypothetical protein DEO40_05150 [Treponema sp.]|jgi:hypothetical protein|nr:hypothetical protein [Treponema sp.]HAK69519.1 hypothetical protein [Treponema sp.]HBB42557.1 hypothetical protein [Treponema sp.]HCA20043.1 hypothetical protein [Treponema sp.]